MRLSGMRPLAIVLTLAGCAFAAASPPGAAEVAKAKKPAAPAKAPTDAEAKKFADDAEQHLLKLWIDQSRADWIKSTHITDDSEILAAQFADKAISAGVGYAK
jgi:hypothetical protein